MTQDQQTRESERDFAVRLANKVLDTPSRDPDDDLAVLARQFLRARELDAEIRSFVLCHPDGNLGEAIMEHVYGAPIGIERRAQDFVRFVAGRTGYAK